MFVKGQSGNPKGKPKGTKNKLTMSLKEAFEAAFHELGGKDGLIQWARREPGEFFKIVSKLFPKAVEHAGAEGGPIVIQVVTGVPKPKKD